MAAPIYRQIADELRDKIDSGEFRPGTQLPTEDVLMDEYRASRNTVRGAIRELVLAGLVYTQHGKGTYVTEPVKPIVTTLTTDPSAGAGGGDGLVYTAEVARSGRSATVSRTRVEVQEADPVVASALRVPEESEVASRQENRFVDGRPWSMQESFYPEWLCKVAPRLLKAAAIEEGTVAYLATCNVRQVGYRDAVEVRNPRQEEIDFLGLPVDGHIQVIEIYRVAFDQEARPMRVTITVYRADRNRFVINVGEVPGREGLPPRGESADRAPSP
jgi:GntR family transcriptional regulator